MFAKLQRRCETRSFHPSPLMLQFMLSLFVSKRQTSRPSAIFPILQADWCVFTWWSNKSHLTHRVRLSRRTLFEAAENQAHHFTRKVRRLARLVYSQHCYQNTAGRGRESFVATISEQTSNSARLCDDHDVRYAGGTARSETSPAAVGKRLTENYVWPPAAPAIASERGRKRTSGFEVRQRRGTGGRRSRERNAQVGWEARRAWGFRLCRLEIWGNALGR